MKKTIIIGSGGHAKSLLGIIKDKRLIFGYCDVNKSKEFKLDYLGSDDDILINYSPSEYLIHCAVVYTEDCNLKLRSKILNRYEQYRKSTFIDESAIISNWTEISEGCEIFERCVVKASYIGSNSIINTGSIVEHGVIIGHNSFLGPGTIVCGGGEIGNNVLIGAGVTIKDDVKICDDVVIGIGSNVINDINEPGVYVGNPSRRIK